MAMHSPEDDQLPIWLNVVMLAVWLAAAAGAFLPFAVGTSPFDAVMRRVPNEEGNWWHILIGAPFFLTFPMIWLRLRALSSRTEPAQSELQRLAVIAAGLGIPLLSISRLVARGRIIGATRACIAILTAAYLANASICLIVYGEAKFGTSSRAGWYLTIAIVWPMLLELAWVLFGTGKTVRQAEAV
jgi:hypothetical protein